jgi:transcriptional regulator with XRE-family HTH domain
MRRELLHLDGDELARAGARVLQYRNAQTTRRNGRRVPLTQAELAARAGVSIGTVQALELGTRRTTVRQIKKIANAIGMSIEELVSPEPTRADVAVSPAVPELTHESLLVARFFQSSVTPTRTAILGTIYRAFVNRRDATALALMEELRVLSPDLVDALAKEGGFQDPSAAAPPGSPFRESLRNGTRSGQ